MTPSTTSFYRQVAAEGATYIGLLTVVLDSLAEDLRLAGLAAAHRDVPARCAASNHAFLLLAHLESWATDLDELPPTQPGHPDRIGKAYPALPVEGKGTASSQSSRPMQIDPLKASLLTFYSYVRSRLLTLQTESRSEPFLDLAVHVTELRITWQTKEASLRQQQSALSSQSTVPHPADPSSAEPRTLRWSA